MVISIYDPRYEIGGSLKQLDEMTVMEFLEIWNEDMNYRECLKIFDQNFDKARSEGKEYVEHPVEHLLSNLYLAQRLSESKLR